MTSKAETSVKPLETFAYDVWAWNNVAGQIMSDRGIQGQSNPGLAVWKANRAYRELAYTIFYEEALELQEAIKDNDTVETWDAIADVLFTLLGIVAKMDGEEVLPQVLQEVIRSNNTKLQDNPGSPVKKLGKGPNYEPPRIKEILEEYGMA